MDRWSRKWTEQDRHRDTARGEREEIEKNRRIAGKRQIRGQTLREKESGRPETPMDRRQRGTGQGGQSDSG